MWNVIGICDKQVKSIEIISRIIGMSAFDNCKALAENNAPISTIFVNM